jgi:hypothetical protein
MLSPRSLRDDLCNLKFFENSVQDCTKPHSAEAPTSADHSQQTVRFLDMVPGHESEQKGSYDELRSEGMDDSVSLQQFFERPVLITDVNWAQGGAALFAFFRPWELFFQNKRVINRISNYKLLQAKLHVKAILNGTPFNFGSAIMSWAPLYPDFDDLTRDRGAISSDSIAASNRPHVYLDPANNSGGTITCPFVWHENALDVVGADWTKMGQMTIRELYPLKHATGTVNNVTISIYAWATEVKLAAPTQYTPSSISPQSDEYSKPAVSTAATALSVWSKGLSNAPIIGPYMRATSMASGAVSAIASLFGYCKPVELEFELLRQRTTGPMATTNSKDDSHKLTVDAKQELTIDPRAFGLANEDELEISYIAGRESWLDTFDWSMGNAPEACLWGAVVDPWMVRQETGGELHMTAMAFASLPFTWWRGSIIYRFQVICSKFHRGRLRVVYDPESLGFFLPGSIAEYNTAFNTIIDISETTDFEIKVGWAMPTSYREHAPPDTPQDDLFLPGGLISYNSLSNSWGNGTIAVYVVNDLVGPDTTIDNDIGINVFVKAGPDFELAGPTSAYINRMAFRPQSEELAMHNLPSTAPLSAPLVDSYVADSNLTGPANLIHFGESVRSFRPLLKRYNMHEYNMANLMNVAVASSVITRQFDRPAMPFERGPAVQSDASSTVPLLTGAIRYAYAYMTLLKYISSAFVGWRGSIRWKISNPMCCEQAAPTMVGRYTGCAPFSGAEGSAFPVKKNTIGNQYDSTSGMDGAIAEMSSIAPIIPFEVPYYSAYRFCPARELTDFRSSGGKPYLPCFKLRSSMIVTTEPTPLKAYTSYCAAGEDFTVGFFVGAPVMFLETSIPVPT